MDATSDTTTCPFAGCGVELRHSEVASHNAASMQAHLDGERAARVASDARLAVCETMSASRVAALGASHAALEADAAFAVAQARGERACCPRRVWLRWNRPRLSNQ